MVCLYNRRYSGDASAHAVNVNDFILAVSRHVTRHRRLGSDFHFVVRSSAVNWPGTENRRTDPAAGAELGRPAGRSVVKSVGIGVRPSVRSISSLLTTICRATQYNNTKDCSLSVCQLQDHDSVGVQSPYSGDDDAGQWVAASFLFEWQARQTTARGFLTLDCPVPQYTDLSYRQQIVFNSRCEFNILKLSSEIDGMFYNCLLVKVAQKNWSTK